MAENKKMEKAASTNPVVKYLKDNMGIIIALGAMLLLLAVMPTTRSNFFAVKNIFNVLRQNASNLFLSCGMTMVIILGGIDLSVGSIIAMSGCFAAAAVVNGGMPVGAGFAIGIASGLIFGLFNGTVIAMTNIPAFIVTLASMNVAKGIAYVYTGGQPIRCMTTSWKFLGAGYVGPVPTPVIVMIVIFAMTALLINRTKFGRHIYAVGGNREAAELSGINSSNIIFLSMIITSTMAALAGILYTARLQSATTNAGVGFEMDAIASAYIGGTATTGGVGKITGTMIGALVISSLANGMNLMNIGISYQYMVRGLVLVAAVLFDVRARRMKV